MNGPTKAYYVLHVTAALFSLLGLLSGKEGAPELTTMIWAGMFMVLSFAGPIIYVYAKADYDIRDMTIEEIIKAYHDK